MSFTVTDAYHIIAVVSIVLGFLACFFGCRLFRLFLALTGFILVGTFGYIVVYYFISPNLIASTIVGSILAVFGSVLIANFPGFGAFLLGSFFGTTLSIVLISGISSNYMQQDETRDITILGFGIMFGILSLHYRRIAIITGTALLGSFGLISGIDHFVHSGFNSILPKMLNGHLSEISTNAFFFILLVSFFVVTIIGVLVQVRQMNKYGLVFTSSSAEYETYSTYSAALNMDGPDGSPNIFSRLFTCRKKTEDNVPLLDVVSLEDY